MRLCATLGALALVIHVVTVAVALWRCRPRTQAVIRGARPGVAGDGATGPGVTLVRPVRGLDRFEAETLRSSFLLTHRPLEILFCVADRADPVVPLVERLIAAHPHIPARLLVGEERLGDNPKLNNMAKGWRAAQYDWVVFADANVLLPPDAMPRLLATMRSDTGLVCSPPVGCAAEGFWSQVECAFLNTYQARWQYAADTLASGFAQGKVMAWRRATLDAAGGMAALGREPAEDAAATKAVRGIGLSVRLVDGPFAQPLGRRSFADVWARQVRWARLRRATFPLFYAPEIITTPWAPAVLLAPFAHEYGATVGAAAGILTLWYAAEALLALACRWPLGWSSPLAWLARDAALPFVWLSGWRAKSVAWRGNVIASIGPEGRAKAS
ncbi:MAG: glycosyltransferase [Rhizobiales bacterium]|nr:glycosyltransferase [Hyphomicrobiales bacterium]